MEKLRTQEKTQNSSKKLKTQGKNSESGRHSPLTCPQVVLKKMPDLLASCFVVKLTVGFWGIFDITWKIQSTGFQSPVQVFVM